MPHECKKHLDWAITKGKKQAEATDWYGKMKDICGIEYQDGTFQDFQRYFKCTNMQNELCNDKGLAFPSTCSVPPCNRCSSIQGVNY